MNSWYFISPLDCITIQGLWFDFCPSIETSNTFILVNCWSQRKWPRSSPLARSLWSWAGHSIAYADTALAKAEKRYCVTRRELLALIGSLSQRRWCCLISLRCTDGPSWTGRGSEMLKS